MATDYVVFIHGVNTREVTLERTYANRLFELIQEFLPGRVLQPVALYWGDISEQNQNDLLRAMQASPNWDEFWFRSFREKQLLQFVGDAALYLSRHVGFEVVKRLKEDAMTALAGATSEDRLHLVAHSWGTVILFDILFAKRWEDSDLEPAIRESVFNLRTALFGLEPAPQAGVPIASLHTMGSPIALFSLISRSGSSHDFTPRLKELLEALYQKHGQVPLPWFNFAHPGDPVAWPLKTILPFLFGEQITRLVHVEDVILRNADLSDFLTQLVSQTPLPVALLNGGDAHGSYWDSREVAEKIAATIASAV